MTNYQANIIKKGFIDADELDDILDNELPWKFLEDFENTAEVVTASEVVTVHTWTGPTWTPENGEVGILFVTLQLDWGANTTPDDVIFRIQADDGTDNEDIFSIQYSDYYESVQSIMTRLPQYKASGAAWDWSGGNTDILLEIESSTGLLTYTASNMVLVICKQRGFDDKIFT